MKMLKMQVGAIGIDKDSGESVILLKDAENRRALPIWVGLPEARAITFAMRHVVSPRPSTHDVLLSTIRQLGCEVKEVVIADIKGETFVAEIVLRQLGASSEIPTISVDARPSDAIVVAAICDVPVMVAPHILAQAGIAANPERDYKDRLEFKEFVESVKASDFTFAGKVELPGDDFEGDPL
jgi:bifunctional DNase/RNase